jgi:2-dehydropantoate 2-reductase
MAAAGKLSTLIWGAGAMGGAVGAYLARANHPVALVDTSSAHVAAIRGNGLSIVGPVDTFTAAIPIFTPGELEGHWDLIMLAVKSQHTEAACRAMAPHLAEGGAVLTLQNGFNDELIAGRFGRERTYVAIGGVVGDVEEPGVIRLGAALAMPTGRVDGKDGPVLQQLVSILRLFNADSFATDDIQSHLWSKHCINGLSSATAMALSPLADLVKTRIMRDILAVVMGEIASVALAHKVTPHPYAGFDPMAFLKGAPAEGRESFFDYVAANTAKDGKPHSGMWRDLNVHRRETETAPLLNPIIDLGRRYGVKTPLLSAVVSTVLEIEHGKRLQHDDNLRELGKFIDS